MITRILSEVKWRRYDHIWNFLQVAIESKPLVAHTSALDMMCNLYRAISFMISQSRHRSNGDVLTIYIFT